MRVRVFKVSGRDLYVFRLGELFIASFTWERLAEKLKCRAFKPLGDTLRGRFELGDCQ